MLSPLRTHLAVVVCGAGPAADVADVIHLATTAGWRVNVVATPSAEPFLDIGSLERLTGQPVRIRQRDPQKAAHRDGVLPGAYLVAPATYNTINKLALGIADTYALTVLAEAIGRGDRTVIVPFVNSALAARAPYRAALRALREEGVRIIAGEQDGWVPHAPGAGSLTRPRFPWSKAVVALGSPLGG